MSRPDATASAALVAEQYIRPVLFVWMDILTDPVRANTSGRTVVVSASGKPDLDGTYDGITADFGDVSPVTVSDGGTGSVTFKLSGIKDLDIDTMNLLNDRSKWQGRTCRLWRLIRDQNDVDKGTIQPFYTGYMVDVSFGGKPEDQWIEIVSENYLVAFSDPTNRTYLSQTDFDPGDMSPKAAISAANGTAKSIGVGGAGAGSVIPGGSATPFGANRNVRNV